MPAGFFLYFEDVDLCLRLRLTGERVGVEPAARADHEYSFHKGPLKWRMLERNRWATVLRNYPGAVLALVLPAMLATELAIGAAALRGGWGRQKAMAAVETLRALPAILRERRGIQASRAISPYDFARWLTAELSSPYLGRVTESPLLASLLRTYWSLVVAALRRRAAATSTR